MGLHSHACGAPLNIDVGQEAEWLEVKVLELESGGPEFKKTPALVDLETSIKHSPPGV